MEVLLPDVATDVSHGKIGGAPWLGLHMAAVRRLMKDTHLALDFAATWPEYDLHRKKRVLLAYATKLTQRPGTVGDSDIDELRGGLVQSAINEPTALISFSVGDSISSREARSTSMYLKVTRSMRRFQRDTAAAVAAGPVYTSCLLSTMIALIRDDGPRDVEWGERLPKPFSGVFHQDKEKLQWPTTEKFSLRSSSLPLRIK